MLILLKLQIDDDLKPLEVPPDENIYFLAQLIQVETNIPINEQHLVLNQSHIPISNTPLTALGITDGSIIHVTISASNSKRLHSEDIPANITAEGLLELVKQHPYVIDQVDNDLAVALRSNNILNIRSALLSRYFNAHKRAYEQQRAMEAIEADPMNEENQRKIEERIRHENIMQNMELAIENLPESFARVQMLYVNIFINDHFVKAFVDSGAQSTIMSAHCAEKCNIMRLLDTRFSGEARGVGTAKILGRIHIAQMKFGNSYYPISITVIENSDVDFLFGLDTLRRYKCVIDLGKSVLRMNNGVNTSGQSDFEEIPFLSDSEIPNNGFGNNGSSENENGDRKEPVGSSGTTSGSGGGSSNISNIGNNNSYSSSTFGSISTNESASNASASASGIASSSSGGSGAVNLATLGQKVAQLQVLGFSESDARNALSQTDGDVGLAASLLMEN